MITLSKRIRLLTVLLLLSLGLWAYQVIDTWMLERSFMGTAAQKRSETAARQPRRGVVTTTVEVAAWRTIPIIGSPRARVAVAVRNRMDTGAEYKQTFDYVFERQGATWAETYSGGCEHSGDSTQEHTHNAH